MAVLSAAESLGRLRLVCHRAAERLNTGECPGHLLEQWSRSTQKHRAMNENTGPYLPTSWALRPCLGIRAEFRADRRRGATTSRCRVLSHSTMNCQYLHCTSLLYSQTGGHPCASCIAVTGTWEALIGSRADEGRVPGPPERQCPLPQTAQ